MEEKVIALISEISGAQDVQLNYTLDGDIGLDSLGMVTLLLELEACIGRELMESDMDPFALKTVSDVVALAEKYCTGGA